MLHYPPERLKALLMRHLLFRNASPAIIDGLIRFATVRRVRANEEIFTKGDSGQSLQGVLSGRICIYTISPENEEVFLNILEPGEIFGEIALMDGGPRTASARAMTEADLLQIHRDHFVPYMKQYPELALSMIPVLCSRIRMNVEFIEDAVFLHLPARLAKRLLALGDTHGVEEPRGIRIRLKLSQQDLAHMIGATRERVNKELNLWRERGLIAMEEGLIVLCNRNRLTQIAAEEPVLPVR
jgi:CRP/FNR family transcriptional regulator, cyclic AMP receptor protein